MRRATRAGLALVLTGLLSGCALLTVPLQPFLPDDSSGEVAPLGIGSCLDGMNGADSDRTALVPCDEPHLFEVTAVEEWPGMADAVDEAGDAGALWDEIRLVNGRSDLSAAYGTWASRACNDAGQRVLGIADIEVDGHTASDLGLFIGGDYNVDLSLGSRAEFVAGDMRTVCSLAWYEGSQTPVRYDGPAFTAVTRPGMSPERRECWDSDYYEVPCSRPHAAQVVVGFDGLVAYDADLIERVGGGDWSDADIETTDDFCEVLLQEFLPATASMDELGYYAESYLGPGWEKFEGEADPEQSYPFVCLAVGWEFGDLITGDVFDGDAFSTPASGSGSGDDSET